MARIVKDRTKTRLGREIEAALISLNDQHAFFLFLEYQFFEQLRALSPTSAEHFTTVAFPGNRYASKIHVRLRDLPSFGEAHRSVTFGAYFTTSYEVASGFTDKALEMLRNFSRTPLHLPPRRREGPEQFYQRALASWALKMPASQLIDTLSFMRYRRNSLVHLNEAPTRPYETLASQSGRLLNTFWMKARPSVDFTIPETKPLAERETLDLLKLLRIVIQRLDTHFASVIDERGLVRVEAARLFGGQRVRMNRYVMEQRMQILRTEIVRNYGLSPRESELKTAVQEVGTR